MSAPAATILNGQNVDGSTMLSIVGTLSGILRSVINVVIAVITLPFRLLKRLLP